MLLNIDNAIGNIESQGDNSINPQIENIKEVVQNVDIETFSGTVDHLEELLTNGKELGIVVRNNLKKGSLNEYEDNSHLLLDGRIKVYFHVEQDDDDKNIILLLIKNDIGFEKICSDRHPKIYEHFTENVNKYRLKK